MKKVFTPASLLTLALISCGLLCSTGCKKDESAPADQPKNETTKPAPGAASAEKTSFHEVTSQLDPGGNFYLYLSTEQLLEGVSGKVSGWRQLFSAIPDATPDALDKIGKAFDVVTRLIRDSGIEDVSGFGMSSIAREKGFYHSKMLVHHYAGKGAGFLWTMFGQKQHALDGLSLLPTNTAVATFSDLDMPLLWSVIQKQTAESGIPEASTMLDKLPHGFEQATGLKWDQVLASLGGEFGFVLTLDESKKITIPLPGDQPMEVPEDQLKIP